MAWICGISPRAINTTSLFSQEGGAPGALLFPLTFTPWTSKRPRWPWPRLTCSLSLGLLWCRVRSELHRTYHFLLINSLLNGGQGLPDSPVESISSESMSNNLSIPLYFTAAWSSPTPFGEGWRQSSHWTWDVLAGAFLNNTHSPLLSSGTDSMTWFRSGNHDARTSAHQARSFFCDTIAAAP